MPSRRAGWHHLLRRVLLACMTLRVDNGADCNQARDGGATPLFIACYEGHEGAARLLLACEGLPPTCNCFGL